MKKLSIKMILMSVLLSFRTAEAGRGLIEEIDPLYKTLKLEIEKDLKGEPSCFKGKVKAKFEYMVDMYGGRFGKSYDLELMRITETIYRAPAKYCQRRLDRNLQEIDTDADDSAYAYRQCINTNLSTSIAGITFGASTSGTREQEGIIFTIAHDVTHDVIVKHDAPYNPEDSEIYSWKSTEEIQCTIIDATESMN